MSLLQEQTATSPERMARALAGVSAYQRAERRPREENATAIAQVGGARLLDYGGNGQPVLFIPSIINPPYVLDLAPDNSMLRHLAANGVHPLLLDWGDPRDHDADFTLADHVEQVLIPMIDAIGGRPALAGYCLGGTLALAAANHRPVRGLALLATPWEFRHYPEGSLADIAKRWTMIEPSLESLGVFPMEVLQSVFWSLDPDRTIAKFEMFGTLDPDGAKARAFVLLEDWANEGPPLSIGAGRDLLQGFFGQDLPGGGGWAVGGKPVDPAAITCPILNIVSLTDRIVPAASAAAAGERMEIDAGHVGMIVGGRARTLVWKPLRQWLSRLR